MRFVCNYAEVSFWSHFLLLLLTVEVPSGFVSRLSLGLNCALEVGSHTSPIRSHSSENKAEILGEFRCHFWLESKMFRRNLDEQNVEVYWDLDAYRSFLETWIRITDNLEALNATWTEWERDSAGKEETGGACHRGATYEVTDNN